MPSATPWPPTSWAMSPPTPGRSPAWRWTPSSRSPSRAWQWPARATSAAGSTRSTAWSSGRPAAASRPARGPWRWGALDSDRRPRHHGRRASCPRPAARPGPGRRRPPRNPGRRRRDEQAARWGHGRLGASDQSGTIQEDDELNRQRRPGGPRMAQGGDRQRAPGDGAEGGVVPYMVRWDDNTRPLPVPAVKVLRLVPGVPIGGVVKDEAGAPVAGARITVIAPPTESDVSYVRFALTETTTDTQGRWRVDDAPADLIGVNVMV